MMEAAFPDPMVVMALPLEAAEVFEQARVPVLYSGVGKINAAVSLTRSLCGYLAVGRPLPLVLNFGTAGSRVHATGTLLGCREFVQRDMDVRGLGFALGTTPYDEVPAMLTFDPVIADLEHGVCGTGDSFVTTACDSECAVMDMEGYALAKVCWLLGAPFGCVKYVTDGADHAAAENWQNNVHRAAQSFLAVYRSVCNGARSAVLAT